VIEILWQSVRRGQCWEIRNNMDYFPNDLVHLGENVLGGKDVLNGLPDFNVDVCQKVREVCNNGLIVKLVFTLTVTILSIHLRKKIVHGCLTVGEAPLSYSLLVSEM